MMNILKYLTSACQILCISILIAGCQVIHDENKIKKGSYLMQNVQQVVTNYNFYEKNNNLFFEIVVENNTDCSININPFIKPFSVAYSNKKLKSNINYPSMSPGFWNEVISVAPNQSYTYQYVLNEENQFLDGKHDYKLFYSYEYNDPNAIESKLASRQVINFTWQKFKDSYKGILVNHDFTDE